MTMTVEDFKVEDKIFPSAKEMNVSWFFDSPSPSSVSQPHEAGTTRDMIIFTYF